MRIFTWEEAVDEGYVNCILSSHGGMFIPKLFIEEFSTWAGISDTNRSILRLGPDSEAYWTAWEEVIEGGKWIDSEGVEWRLYSDGDLFAVRTNIEIDFDTFH